MKKIALLIAFLFLKQITNAQKNYVIFFQTYEFTEGGNDTIIGHYPELLVINDSVSYSRPFYNEEKIKFKNGMVGNDFQSHAEYCNFSTKKIVRQSHLAGKFERIIYDTIKFNNWEIKDTVREILGYKCKLAILKINDWKYEAWFTTELPQSERGMLHSGLPGTALEKVSYKKNSKRRVLQKAMKIENTFIKIVEPTIGKVISDEDARKILEESQKIYMDIH